MINLTKLNLMFFILISISTNCFSAPSINNVSGLISNGNSIVLYGSSFGSHPNYNEGSFQWKGAKPLVAKFKDFNDKSITSLGWTNGYPAQNSLVSGGRSSGYYLKEQFVSDERTQVQYGMRNTTGEYFVSFWFMMPDQTQAGKFWRVYGSGSAGNIYLSTGCVGDTLRGFSECTDSECSPETVWGSSSSLGGGTWRRVDIHMDDSKNIFNVSVDGVTQIAKKDWMGNPFGGNGHTMDFGNMIDEPGASRCSPHPTWNGSYNYDDIFVNYTIARVELCSGSSWSNKGTCDVQLPTEWGSSSITASVNTGAFTSGKMAYLYVVDDSGTANATGYPVALGGQLTSPPPEPVSPPLNLRMQ